MKAQLMKAATVAVVTLSLATPFLASAQGVPNLTATTAPPPITTPAQVYGFTLDILGYLQTFFWIIAAIFIVLAAYKYLTAGGAEDKVKSAKQMLIYAVIAIIIALISTAVVGAVSNFLRS